MAIIPGSPVDKMNIAKKNKGITGGRHLLFKSKEELQEKIDKYFESCFDLQWKERDYRTKDGLRVKIADGTYQKEPYQEEVLIKVPTISGLAYHLKTNRTTLINYEKKEEYFNTIKNAKQFIESIQEEGLIKGTLNATGTIFNLKNNFGWVDKQEIDNKISGNLSLVSLHNKIENNDK